MKEKGKGIGGFSTFFIILFILGLYLLIGQLGKAEEINGDQFAKALSKIKAEVSD